jgi:phosphomannomutase
VQDLTPIITAIEHYDWKEPFAIKRVDGIDMIFAEWRLNIRSSNTEPVIRLNVEAKGKIHLIEQKIEDIINIINLKY